MAEKPLRVACAEAEGWKRRTESPHWFRDDPRMLYESPPPYGESTAEGHALTVGMMHAHKIGAQPVTGLHCSAVPGRHWEAFADNPRDQESLICACGATVDEAVARCRVALAEADEAVPSG